MYFLTEPQVKILQKVINDYRRREVNNGRGGSSLALVSQANDFYMFYLSEAVPPMAANSEGVFIASSVKGRVGALNDKGELTPVQYPDETFFELDVYNTSSKRIGPNQWVQGHLNKSGFWVLTPPPVALGWAQAPEGGLPARQGGVLGQATACAVLIEAPEAGANYIQGELVKNGATVLIRNYGGAVVASEGDRLIQHDGEKIVGYDCENEGDPNVFKTLEEEGV